MSMEDDHEPQALQPIEGHFTSVFAATAQEPEWIIKDMCPIGVMFIGGPPKLSNKSTMTLAMAAIVAGYENDLFPPHMRIVEQHGTVQIYSAEADAGVIKYMMTVNQNTKIQDDDGILIADDPWAFRLDKEEGLKQLLFWLDERKPKLVILDPFKNFHSVDEKDSGMMFDIVQPLRKWAITNKACIVFVHHTKKLGDNDKRDYNEMDLRGTSALFGIADAVHIITPVDPAKLIVRIRATFKRGAGWERTIRLAAYHFKDRPAAEIFDEVTEQVFKAYVAGCETMDEVATQVHVAKSRVVDCVDALVRNGLLRRDGKKIKVVK